MKDIVQKKLESLNPEGVGDEINFIKELSQEIILYALSKTDFFTHALFQGGTCLRLVHGMNRFSEDLDFSLKNPSSDFNLDYYLTRVQDVTELYGYSIEFSGKNRMSSNVRSRMLKDDSIMKELDLKYIHDYKKKIKIKIELDINPPQHAEYESNHIRFPRDFVIMTHDKPSLFAGKCHALLQRRYTKGRDWYDYLWYVDEEININWDMLKSALEQSGKAPNKLSKSWLKSALTKRIKSIDWSQSKRDIEKFIRPDSKNILEIWNDGYFIKKTKKFFDSL